MRVGGISVEIEHQIFGACRRGGFEFLDMQNAVFNRPARDRACASGTAKLAQPHVEASLPVCQPFLRPQWHSETTAFRDGLCRNECVFQIAIAPGPSKPDISGAERMALSQILQVNSMLTMGEKLPLLILRSEPMILNTIAEKLKRQSKDDFRAGISRLADCTGGCSVLALPAQLS